MAIGVIATIPVQEGKNDEFEAVFMELAAQVLANEPGCKFYALSTAVSRIRRSTRCSSLMRIRRLWKPTGKPITSRQRMPNWQVSSADARILSTSTASSKAAFY